MKHTKNRGSNPVPRGKPRKASNRMSRPSLGRVRVPEAYPWVVASRLLDDIHEHMIESDVDRVRALLRARDIDGIMDLSKDWGLQCTTPDSEGGVPDTLVCRLLFGALLKKYPFKGNSLGRRENAIQACLDGESTCSAFNRVGYKSLINKESRRYANFIGLATGFISQVLGPLDEDKVMRWCRHGPGSSTSSSGGNVSVYYKYSEWPYHVTADAVPHAKRLIQSDQRWLGALEDSYRERHGIAKYHILNQEEFWRNILTVVVGNRITTVPKDYHKDRPIAIEPTLNLLLQLGVDGHIRRRLRRWGIDLNSQFKNQRLARLGTIGSHADKPATIDLSNASDSVSLRICKILLPSEWYRYVCDIRSPQGDLPDGRRLRYSKLASMGNGTTFVIESLLFTALTYAASIATFGAYQRDSIAVYGDDIICPESMAPLVRDYLEYCGFSLNSDKSFLEGPVKESCGTDWILGRMVRPVFLKKHPDDVCALYAHRNLLVRWAKQHLGVGLPRLDALYLRWIPEPLRLYGPLSDEEFSGYLHSEETGPWKGQQFHYKSIVKCPIKQKGKSFFFRKLMATLQETAPVQFRDLTEAKLTSVSSAFDVTSRGKERLCMIKRVDPVWIDSYRAPGAGPYSAME